MHALEHETRFIMDGPLSGEYGAWSTWAAANPERARTVERVTQAEAQVLIAQGLVVEQHGDLWLTDLSGPPPQELKEIAKAILALVGTRRSTRYPGGSM
jgi:hypothetical protein